MARSSTSMLITVSFALIGWAAAALIPRDNEVPSQNLITVDVCVVGGGAAGTYAAIKSKDLNKSVVVVEQQGRLGGHAKTYVDPATNISVELGVAEYEDTPIVREFFARFQVPLYAYNFTLPGVTSEYVDFQTGQIATPAADPNLLLAWNAFQAQVAKYPFLNYSLDSVPYPVPADLLLPFGEFINKYNLSDAVPYLSVYGQGWGNFVTLPTLLAIKFFGPTFFSPASLYSGGGGALAAKDNSLIYEKATTELGASVLLNSSVLSMDRNAADLVKITVQTPSGKKLIHAKKLISAIPPVIDNLKGFDLNATEVPIFDKFKGHSWYVGLVNNSGVPDNVTLINYGTNNTQAFNIPVLPGLYDFYATAVPGLKYWLYGGNDNQTTFTQSQVTTGLQDTVAQLQAGGSIPASSSSGEGAKTLEVIDYTNHSPYEVYAESSEIAKGFYNKVFNLQGQRNTYWTGAAFVTHSSAQIWNYTDELVTRIWANEPVTDFRYR